MPKLEINGDGLHIEQELSRSEALELAKKLPTERTKNEKLAKLSSSLTRNQEAYLEALASKNGEWVSNEQARGMMEDIAGKEYPTPRVIAGLRSGLTQKSVDLFGEKIDEREWNEELDQNVYRIKPKFATQLRKILKR